MPKKKESTQTHKQVTVRQVYSGAGRKPDQIATLLGLGLGKINKVKSLEDTPSVRGMITKSSI